MTTAATTNTTILLLASLTRLEKHTVRTASSAMLTPSSSWGLYTSAKSAVCFCMCTVSRQGWFCRWLYWTMRKNNLALDLKAFFWGGGICSLQKNLSLCEFALKYSSPPLWKMLLGPGQFIFFSYCSIKSLTKSLLSYSHITPNSQDVFFLMIKNLCFFGLKYCTPPRSEKCGSRASFFPYCSTLILILFALKYSAPGLARKMQVDRASFFFHIVQQT